MAYDNKFISLRAIIESVYRDSGIEEINFETAIEDAAELIGLMGIPYTYIDMATDGVMSPIVAVTNYRALLPNDLAYLVSMRKIVLDSENTIINSEQMVESSNLYQYSRMGDSATLSNFVPPTASAPIMKFDENEAFVATDGQIVGEATTARKTTPYSYKINNNIIYTDFKDGYLNIIYKAFPTDEEGFLMIPDDEKLRAAVKYHLIYKIDYRRWRAFPEKPGLKALLNDSEQSRDFYVGAARNKAHIPSIDKMESIKNTMLRSIPKINEHVNGFKTLTRQERRKF